MFARWLGGHDLFFNNTIYQVLSILRPSRMLNLVIIFSTLPPILKNPRTPLYIIWYVYTYCIISTVIHVTFSKNSVFIVYVYNIILNIFYLIYYGQEHCCICDTDQKTPMFIEFIKNFVYDNIVIILVFPDVKRNHYTDTQCTPLTLT